MNRIDLRALLGTLIFVISSCTQSEQITEDGGYSTLRRADYKVNIDSMYVYPGDTLYNDWVKEHNFQLQAKTRALSPEDDAFFSKQYVVKSTESTLLYGKNYIYLGSVLEGNSIISQEYNPVFVKDRNPITVSMSLTHNTPKPTSRTIESPTFSKLDDYIKEMVADGNFSQTPKFMFQTRRFSFYDEIKSVFGSNINVSSI